MTRWLGVVALLAVPVIANAECAWVLWWEDHWSRLSYRSADTNLPGARNERQETREWNILGSYPTYTACERQQEWKIGDMLKAWQKDKADAKSGEHTISHEVGSNIISESSRYVNENTSRFTKTIGYLCLPETLDPRAPK